MSRQDNPIVLGQQMADAQTKEQARLEAGPLQPSPMPKDQYGSECIQHDLISIVSLPLDDKLSTLAATFRGWDPEERAAARNAISLNEQYTLIQFAKRSAVLALRESSEARCEDGLTALSMLDETRIDPRDAMGAVGLISHAISETKAGRNSLVDRAVALATPGMARILQAARKQAKLSAWGYWEVRTEGGVGLISAGFASYKPTIDMTGLAMKIVASIEKGRYVASPEIAVDLPAIWFAPEHRVDAEKLLKQAHACINVRGSLRERENVEARGQMFIQWVVEMPTEREANRLVDYVGQGTALDDRFTVGVASGRFFSMIVAGSCISGVAPIESLNSLAPFVEETRAILAGEK